MLNPEFTVPKIISVSQLNFYVKSLLEGDVHLSAIFVTGEISNLTDHYRSGHIYMSLKDNKSVIRAVMFAGNAKALKFKPDNGMKVIVRGRVALYETTGQYQLYIEDMQPDGIGALTVAFEQLKKSLQEKGLFESEHKKSIPEYPKNIGVITSPTGAALQDILNIINRRFPCANVTLCPVLVQGDNAAKQLVNAVETLNKYSACDLIIIGRGGGSIEDLWAFNDEQLAYAIYNCKIPVISAVGHETDFTICDFVADMRAPTPSAAAEIAVPDRAELLSNYDTQNQYLNAMISSKISEYDAKLSSFASNLKFNSPQTEIQNHEKVLNVFYEQLSRNIDNYIDKKFDLTQTIGAKVEALSPVAVLNRGYAIVESNGNRIDSSKTLNNGDIFSIAFQDGKIKAQVKGDS